MMKNEKPTMVQIDPGIKDKLKEVAKQKGYTLRGLLEKIVKEYLAKEKSK